MHKINGYPQYSITGKHLHGLASAASGYHRVLEENRKLYNQLQDLKGKEMTWLNVGLIFNFNETKRREIFIRSGNIRVYCRVRPFLGEQSNNFSTISNIEEGSISISSRNGREGKKTFSFNRVFGPRATQGLCLFVFSLKLSKNGNPCSFFHDWCFLLQRRFSLTPDLSFVRCLMVTMSAYLRMARLDQEKHILW